MSKVIHQIEKCIGCGNCVVAAPEHFEMGDKGKAHLIDAEEENSNEVKKVKITEELKQAANSCPVQCIKLEE